MSSLCQISHVGKTHRLIVHEVVMGDAGQYSCVTDGAETHCKVTVKGQSGSSG